jgi:hypothetical protein
MYYLMSTILFSLASIFSSLHTLWNNFIKESFSTLIIYRINCTKRTLKAIFSTKSSDCRNHNSLARLNSYITCSWYFLCSTKNHINPWLTYKQRWRTYIRRGKQVQTDKLSQQVTTKPNQSHFQFKSAKHMICKYTKPKGHNSKNHTTHK